MRNLAVPAAAILALILAAPAAGQNTAGGAKIETSLTGAAEAPGPGDADGTGSFSGRVNPGQKQVCYDLSVMNVDTPTAAHIHEAPAGVAGPVVVTLIAPATGSSTGCATITRELALELIKTPSDYYVNVHNAAFPAGAVRGQLTK